MRRLVLLAAAIALSACAAADPPPTSRVAVVSAFAPEWQALKAQTRIERADTVNGVEFVVGNLAGRDVVLFLSGISMVNATMTTQLALDRYPVSHIVVSGIAGGVDPALRIGDVTVAARWAQYQDTLYARDTARGYHLPPWAEKDKPNYGPAFPQSVRVRRAGGAGEEKKFWFDADTGMLEAARTVAGSVALKRCTADNRCLERTPTVTVGGAGVSGPTFVDNARYRQYVQRAFQAQVLDMETAAIAHVAYANGKPFVAFRSLSDLAGGGPGENEIGAFFQLAADNAAAVVVEFLKTWKP